MSWGAARAAGATMFGADAEVAEAPIATSYQEYPLGEPLPLPTDVKFHKISGGREIAISPSKANWLTLEAQEIMILKLLMLGLSPKEAMETATNKSGAGPFSEVFEGLRSLLGKIAQHNFSESFVAHDQLQKNVAHLYLTNACNLRCKHCYMKSGLAEAQQVPLSRWLTFLKGFKEFGGTHVNLSGGEALYYSGFWEVLAKCKDLDLNVYVLSNGLLVNAASAQAIADAAYQIQISVDGPNARSNDSLRGRGSYDKAMAGLYHFRGLDIAVRVAMIATPQTIEEFERDFVPFARRLYQDFGRQLQLRVSVDVIEGRTVSRYDPSTKAALQSRVDKLFDQLWGYDTRSHSDAVGYKRGLLNKNCGFGREISVKSTGEAYPCPIQINPIGHIATDRIDDLFRATRLQDRDKSIDNFEDCRGCDLRYLCGGGCRVANYEMTGDYKRPYFCSEQYVSNFYERLGSADSFVASYSGGSDMERQPEYQR